LRSEIGSLQKDNLDLYEKTRYVSTYNAHSRGPASSASSYAANPNPSTVNISGATDASDRYKASYESNLSPFAAFRGRESARAMKRMHIFERIILRVTKFVLQTRTSRNMFAGYLIALHFIAFYMLFADGGMSAAAGSAVVGAAAPGGPIAAGADDPTAWQKTGLEEDAS
jgi:homeobox protein cut-like